MTTTTTTAGEPELAGWRRQVAVSPQTPDQSLTFAEQKALEFPVLSHAGNAVAPGTAGLVFAEGESATAPWRHGGRWARPADAACTARGPAHPDPRVAGDLRRQRADRRSDRPRPRSASSRLTDAPTNPATSMLPAPRL